ncbi:MAG: phosphoribosylglycinamide formyltransferase [Candidatus Bilamarchaeaceae archaeon]
MVLALGVLASGRGSNFQAILDAIQQKKCDAIIRVLITDNPAAKAIEIAQKNNIPVKIINKKDFPNRVEFDLEIKKTLDEYHVDLVVLAGYMRIILSDELLESYKYRIINIHPSLLPAFKGSTHAQHDAFNYGCKISGLTIHFVSKDVDGGEIIYQEAVDISKCKNGDEVAAEILKHEHNAYPKVIDMFAKGTFVIKGRRVEYHPK